MAFINKEKIRKLEEIIAYYPDILSEFEIKDQIIKAFKFEKPLTSIEVDREDNEKVIQFMKEMEDFFFVGHIYFEPESREFRFSGLIFISRFKNLLDVVIKYANEYNGLLDEFADLSGILCGISTEEVAEYCSKERLKKFNLMK